MNQGISKVGIRIVSPSYDTSLVLKYDFFITIPYTYQDNKEIVKANVKKAQDETLESLLWSVPDEDQIKVLQQYSLLLKSGEKFNEQLVVKDRKYYVSYHPPGHSSDEDGILEFTLYKEKEK